MLSYIKYNKFINFQVPRHYLALKKNCIYSTESFKQSTLFKERYKKTLVVLLLVIKMKSLTHIARRALKLPAHNSSSSAAVVNLRCYCANAPPSSPAPNSKLFVAGFSLSK